MEEQQFQRLQTKIVDSREPDTIKTTLLETGWYQRALPCGDYSFFSVDFKKVGIERKTVSDLLGSINSERLAKQLDDCLDYYDYTVLLIEGSHKIVSEEDQRLTTVRGVERFTWKELWNYLLSYERLQIMPQLVIDEDHTIKRVNELYAYFQKPFHLTGKSRGYTDSRILAFPSGCRGKTAMEVLNMFKSIEMICRCSIKDLMHVDGVGQKKAELIFEHFHKGTDEVEVIKAKTLENRIKDLDKLDEEQQGQLPIGDN